MIEIIERIIELQDAWTASNSPEMIERGKLVRDELPAAIGRHGLGLSHAIGIPLDDLGIVGRDGSGRKTAIPWVRIFSRDRSPDPRNGWYIVLLFHSEGNKLYLCISHGSTDWTGGEFKPKPAAEVEPLMKWATGVLKPFMDADPSLSAQMDLGSRGKLGRPYEASTPVSKMYDVANLPTEAEFLDDLLLFGKMLRIIYNKDDLGLIPGSDVPVFQRAQEEIKSVSEGRQTRGGQGYGLSAKERSAVEAHAMKMAEAHLTMRGFSCEITAAHSPFDMVASSKDEEFIVEVKGTTSLGSHIILTANEVAAHKAKFPNNALILVHSIELRREAPGVLPEASGGVLVFKREWELQDADMKPLAFQVKV